MSTTRGPTTSAPAGSCLDYSAAVLLPKDYVPRSRSNCSKMGMGGLGDTMSGSLSTLDEPQASSHQHYSSHQSSSWRPAPSNNDGSFIDRHRSLDRHQQQPNDHNGDGFFASNGRSNVPIHITSTQPVDFPDVSRSLSTAAADVGNWGSSLLAATGPSGRGTGRGSSWGSGGGGWAEPDGRPTTRGGGDARPTTRGGTTGGARGQHLSFTQATPLPGASMAASGGSRRGSSSSVGGAATTALPPRQDVTKPRVSKLAPLPSAPHLAPIGGGASRTSFPGGSSCTGGGMMFGTSFAGGTGGGGTSLDQHHMYMQHSQQLSHASHHPLLQAQHQHQQHDKHQNFSSGQHTDAASGGGGGGGAVKMGSTAAAAAGGPMRFISMPESSFSDALDLVDQEAPGGHPRLSFRYRRPSVPPPPGLAPATSATLPPRELDSHGGEGGGGSGSAATQGHANLELEQPHSPGSAARRRHSEGLLGQARRSDGTQALSSSDQPLALRLGSLSSDPVPAHTSALTSRAAGGRTSRAGGTADGTHHPVTAEDVLAVAVPRVGRNPTSLLPSSHVTLEPTGAGDARQPSVTLPASQHTRDATACPDADCVINITLAARQTGGQTDRKPAAAAEEAPGWQDAVSTNKDGLGKLARDAPCRPAPSKSARSLNT